MKRSGFKVRSTHLSPAEFSSANVCKRVCVVGGGRVCVPKVFVEEDN